MFIIAELDGIDIINSALVVNVRGVSNIRTRIFNDLTETILSCNDTTWTLFKDLDIPLQTGETDKYIKELNISMEDTHLLKIEIDGVNIGEFNLYHLSNNNRLICNPTAGSNALMSDYIRGDKDGLNITLSLKLKNKGSNIKIYRKRREVLPSTGDLKVLGVILIYEEEIS